MITLVAKHHQEQGTQKPQRASGTLAPSPSVVQLGGSSNDLIEWCGICRHTVLRHVLQCLHIAPQLTNITQHVKVHFPPALIKPFVAESRSEAR